MSVLPISNIINVTITNTPSGFGERNVNTLGLLTTETPSNVDPFRIYISAAQVAEDFGTNSVTAAMANNIFAQTPNIRTGKGELVIIPLVASVSATAADFASSDITTNLAAILAVSDGDLTITIDGTDFDLVDLDFTAGNSFDDIAQVLQQAIPAGIATISGLSTGFTIVSHSVGALSEADISTFAGTGTDVSTAGTLDASGGTPTAGVDSSGETISEAIVRTEGDVFYAGVITDLAMEDAEIVLTAATIQSRDKIFVHQGSSVNDIAGIGTTIQQATQDKTRILVYAQGVAEANLMKSAYVGRAFSVNFSGFATSSTMNLKELVSVTPDTNINQTLYLQAETAGTDLYVSYEGVPSVFSTGGNDFFDNVYNDLQLKFALEAAGFNHLRQTNTKIPQTEPGMEGLKNAYARVMDRFVTVGAVAPGSWTSPDTFGDPEIFKENVEQRGYYIFSQPITQQSSIERDAREAPLVQIAVKRAGAIHTSDVLVLVNN